jgi:hypothetical protein
MKKKSFIQALPSYDGRILCYPWEHTGESFYITEDDKRLLDKRANQFTLAAIYGFLAIVIFNIATAIPVFTLGIAWINVNFLAMIVFLVRLCGKSPPNLNPSETQEEGAPARRKKLRRRLFFYGLIQSLVALHGEAQFPAYPCIEISCAIALFYVGMLLTLMMTKGRPLEYWAQRTGEG